MRRADRPTREGLKALRALKRAVAAVLEEHRRLGLPVAVMHKGKAVLIPVEKALAYAKRRRGQ
jgi:hypothetical protein